MFSTEARDRVAHHSHLWVLPVAGSLAVAIGALALVPGVREELLRYLPLTLLAVGSVALLGAYASHPWHRGASGGPSEPRAAVGDSAPMPVPAASVSRRSDTVDSGPTSGLGRAAVSAVAHVGDELWRRWSTPRMSSLGAQLVGPVPATAYTPPRDRAVVPFPYRDRDILFLPDPPTPPARAAPVAPPPPAAPTRVAVRAAPPAAPMPLENNHPFSDDDLDRLFPLDLPRPSPAAGVPAPSYPSGRTLSADPDEELSVVPMGDVGPLSTGPVGLLPTLDEYDHPTGFGRTLGVSPAIGRIPARASSPSRGLGEPSHPVPERICSDCARRLSDFRSWGECPGCRQPICRLCLSLSFVTGAMGACSECARVRPGSVS